MCTEQVYNNNIFHLLGLNTTATPRQIRRRREDIDSAKDFGADSWKNEFRHLLGNRSLPSEDEINEAFDKLEDPEYRIVSEFFWMWPMEEDDPALGFLTEGRRSDAFDVWEQAALGFGRKRSIAQHNLAVAYQLYAIDAELQAIDFNGAVPPDYKATMCEYWEKSFAYWEDLADNDDFWELFERRMREFDDPRLTGGFVRRLREEFPIAFDNINARLAFEYARRGKHDEARRHVEYMKQTMSGLDDVEKSFESLFEPVEKRLAVLVKRYDEKIKQSPSSGSRLVKDFLADAVEIINVTTGLLDSSSPIKIRILSDIVLSSNGYLVAFGNKTQKWKECLELNQQLMSLACTSDLKKKLEANAKVLRENIIAYNEENTCWACKRTKDTLGTMGVHAVKMYGEVSRDYRTYGRVTYSTRTIEIPCCSQCRPLSSTKVRSYPAVQKALANGWKIGDGPDQDEMRRVWGLPPASSYTPSSSSGCLVPLAIITAALLAGCAAIF